jgi:uncharacterized protein (TIGR03000 family)
MTHPRRLALVLCCAAALLALSPDRGSGDDKPAKTTTLKVIVHQKRVKVLIDGKEIKIERTLEHTIPAPPLAEGKKEYEVTVTWAPNNYTRFFRKRKVEAKPGETVVVDLSKEDPANKDEIKIRYVPTPNDVVRRMCKLGNVGKDDIVFDLGCGDGRLVITAVAEFKAKRGVGVDLDPERIKESVANGKDRGVSDKVAFRVEDVLKLKDLSDASVVLLYMGDDVNLRLRPILQKTLKPGSRIVSHRFTMGDWKPDKTETFVAEDGDEYQIHLWTIKK